MLEKGALQAGSKYFISSCGYVERGIITAKMLAPVAIFNEKQKGTKVSIVCKADLMSVVNAEDAKRAEALIDNLLTGGVANSLRWA